MLKNKKQITTSEFKNISFLFGRHRRLHFSRSTAGSSFHHAQIKFFFNPPSLITPKPNQLLTHHLTPEGAIKVVFHEILLLHWIVLNVINFRVVRVEFCGRRMFCYTLLWILLLLKYTPSAFFILKNLKDNLTDSTAETWRKCWHLF